MNAARFTVSAAAALALLSVNTLLVAAPTPYTPDAGTQLLYHLDETTGTTATDSSGHERNATYGSQVLKGQAAQTGFGTAIQSQSSSSARTTFTDTGKGNTSFLYAGTTPDFTIEAWVKMKSPVVGSYAKVIDVQPVGSVPIDYSLFIFNNAANPQTLSFGDATTANKVFVGGGLTWDPNTWYHIAAVVHQDTLTPANSYIKLYRNAAGDLTPHVVASLSGATALLATNSSTADRMFDIGNYYGANGAYYFPGEIDDVRFSNVARTSFDTLVPEPATAALILLGGGILAMRRRRGL
jgi:hypothetical protein